jgi:hypothetical protein
VATALPKEIPSVIVRLKPCRLLFFGCDYGICPGDLFAKGALRAAQQARHITARNDDGRGFSALVARRYEDSFAGWQLLVFRHASVSRVKRRSFIHVGLPGACFKSTIFGFYKGSAYSRSYVLAYRDLAQPALISLSGPPDHGAASASRAISSQAFAISNNTTRDLVSGVVFGNAKHCSTNARQVFAAPRRSYLLCAPRREVERTVMWSYPPLCAQRHPEERTTIWAFALRNGPARRRGLRSCERDARRLGSWIAVDDVQGSAPNITLRAKGLPTPLPECPSGRLDELLPRAYPAVATLRSVA